MWVPTPTITKIKHPLLFRHSEERSDEESRSPNNEILPFGRNDNGHDFQSRNFEANELSRSFLHAG
jgi:hypothetical protein